MTVVARRHQPRMSAAKLGKCLEAAGNRRERNVAEQKFPPAFKTAPYTAASRVISEAFTSKDPTEVLEPARVPLLERLPVSRFSQKPQGCDPMARRASCTR